MLQVLHTDIMGPMPITSYDGKKYILTVYDDYSKLASVVCLKSKDEAPAVLIAICNQLEKQLFKTGEKVMSIRSDNGKEYINAAIKKFCDNMGILPEHSAPYMPQSNGSAEFYNFKLQAKATALLL
jgi:transposase InsO family protein